MKFSLTFLSLLVAIMILINCSEKQKEKGKEIIKNNVEPALFYSKDRPSHLENLSMKLISTFGSDDDERYIFANIQDIVVDSQGYIYILF